MLDFIMWTVVLPISISASYALIKIAAAHSEYQTHFRNVREQTTGFGRPVEMLVEAHLRPWRDPKTGVDRGMLWEVTVEVMQDEQPRNRYSAVDTTIQEALNTALLYRDQVKNNETAKWCD